MLQIKITYKAGKGKGGSSPGVAGEGGGVCAKLKKKHRCICPPQPKNICGAALGTTTAIRRRRVRSKSKRWEREQIIWYHRAIIQFLSY